MAHWLRLKRDGEGTTVDPVVVKINEHEPARKQLIEHRSPALLAGENLVLVEQDQLVCLSANQRNVPAAEGPYLVDLAIGLNHALGEGMGVGQLRERVAYERISRLAGDVGNVCFVRFSIAPMRKGPAFGPALGSGGLRLG